MPPDDVIAISQKRYGKHKIRALDCDVIAISQRREAQNSGAKKRKNQQKKRHHSPFLYSLLCPVPFFFPSPDRSTIEGGVKGRCQPRRASEDVQY